MKCDSRLQDFLLTPWWKTGRMYKLIPEKPARSNDYTLMTWTKVEADSVWMVGGYMPPGNNSDRGINAVYLFRRIAGKWYLVDGFIEDHAA